MKKIGLTGGIGSGKTTIATIFKILGVPVYNSDLAAKHLVNTDEELKNKLTSIFGKNTFVNGVYNSKYIAEIVFNDSEKLKLLNNLIHPFVKKDFELWCKNLQKNGVDYVLKEAAILFESNANKGLDKIIVVTAPKEIRIKRVVSRDSISENQVKLRMKKQFSEEELVSKSDFVIDNSGKILVIPQVLKIHEKILSTN